MPVPKHEATKKREKKPRPQPQQNTVVLVGPDSNHIRTPSMQHDINHVAGLAGVEESLDWIARGISRLTGEDNSVCLATGYDTPLKIALSNNDHDDTMDRLVTAIERIADSAAKLAGLNRPRLESWHEQDQYEPRYKDIAVDGGATGPKPNATEAQNR
jgi:hypothetical protein